MPTRETTGSSRTYSSRSQERRRAAHLAQHLTNLCAQLEHWARRLHVTEHLDRVLEIAAQGSAAERQLAVLKDNKTALKEVVRLYLAETSDI